MALLSPSLSLATFPSHKPFIDVLADHVLSMQAADALVLLPTRRACTAFRDACLRATDGAPLILPRLVPLGDVDESEWFFEHISHSHPDASAFLAPAPIGRTRRHILLTRLVAVFTSEVHNRPKADMEDAALLAQELATLLDDAAREELSLDELKNLVPPELAVHWEKTLRFLNIVAEEWPGVLESLNLSEPLIRRNRMLRMLAAHWQTQPPAYPVIAAGSTGSQPASADLLAAIARLPRGQVILPGFDGTMSREAWDMLAETHPQFGMKQLLKRMGAKPADVQLIDATDISESCDLSRIHLLRTALLPAECTHGWKSETLALAPALHNIRRLEAESMGEEARAITLLLRGVLETPGKSAALITHDRTLARMVSAQLQRYDVDIDDSAGKRADTLVPATFLSLLAEMAMSRAAPVPLLSLLKHPLAAAGMPTAECRASAREVETALLHGVRLSQGFTGMRHALARIESVSALAHTLLERVESASAPFMELLRLPLIPFADLLRAHLTCAEALATTDTESGETRLWSTDEGASLATALGEIMEYASGIGEIDPQNYPALLLTLLGNFTYRPTYGRHPRLFILSPLEARLQHFDLVILGGLSEGSWPPAAQSSAWMSRPMQKLFGLPAPERETGLSAHDFIMLSAAREVILSRSIKNAGALTVPSRWLRRIDTLLAAQTGSAHHWPVPPELEWARALTQPAPAAALIPPAPTPPLSARPTSLSVTDIETWLRDPYALYAKRILRLAPFEPIDKDPGASEFGTLLHRTMESFTQRFPDELPDHAEKEWLACAEEAFARLKDRPAVRAFWWRRIERIARFVTLHERERRPIARVQAEQKKERQYPGMKLRTRIDRLEHRSTGAVVADYKTGRKPTKLEIEEAIALQLPLEASISGEKVSGLEYWVLSGREFTIDTIAETHEDAAALIESAEARLSELITAYNDPAMPYLAEPLLALAKRNDYAHLERKKEWQS